MTNDDVGDFLEHFGVKGMKWGRRTAASAGKALANQGVGQQATVTRPDGTKVPVGTGREAQKHAAKLQQKVDATDAALKTGIADKKVLSRKDVRQINKLAERDFYNNKAEYIRKEAMKGDDVIIATRLPQDHAVTLAGGRDIVNHMASGGVLDIKMTEVMYRRNSATDQYEQNTQMIGNYKKIRRA